MKAIYKIGTSFHAVTHGPERPLSAIKYIALHSMEDPDRNTAATELGHLCQSTSYGASPHYGVDNKTVQCYLAISTEGWGITDFNYSVVHIEQAGRAANTTLQWKSMYGGTLERAAWLLAYLSGKTGVPLTLLTIAKLKALGKTPARPAGIVTHAMATAAFHESTHTDPGANYPLEHVLDMARAYLAAK